MERRFLASTERLAEAVRTGREQRGWSRQELAERAGVPLLVIASVEDGHKRLPVCDVLAVLGPLEIHATAVPAPPPPDPSKRVDLAEHLAAYARR